MQHRDEMMKSQKPTSQQASNVVVKHFPKDKSTESDIVIVDTRCCLRDAMAASLRSRSERRVFTANCADSLATSRPGGVSSSSQVVLFCDGCLVPDQVVQEVKKLCSYRPDAMIALLTDHSHGDISSAVFTMLDGLIPTYYETNQVLACIQLIESGIKYTPASYVDGDSAYKSNQTPAISKKATALLTPRQRQVMEYISEGRSNKYIAAELSVSESTIKVHVHEAMRRLGATSRTHASYILSHSE